MKPTFEYNESLLKNDSLFKDSFYSRFKLKPFTLQLDDQIQKTYQFPTFYGDVTVAIGIFTCSYDNAKAMMPHPEMKPVILKPGKAMVIFSCYEYKNVLGIPSYNEIAMTIPVMVAPKMNIPALPMVLSDWFKEFGYYVFSMPVTSLENQIRGHKIWGLPKVVEEIDIHQKNGKCVTVAKDSDGKPYFELTVPMTGKKKAFDVTSNLYSKFDNRLVQAETNFKADFFVGKDYNPAEPCLKIYDTPAGKVLKNLEIDAKPFQFRYAEHMTACFDLPNVAYKAPFKF